MLSGDIHVHENLLDFQYIYGYCQEEELLPFNIAENYPEVFYVGLKDVVIWQIDKLNCAVLYMYMYN